MSNTRKGTFQWPLLPLYFGIDLAVIAVFLVFSLKAYALYANVARKEKTLNLNISLAFWHCQ